MDAADYDTLERHLGYHFKDKDFLRLALTHASIRGGRKDHYDNERLEFLGDRVLGLVIAELVHERFSNAREGELARRYNRLVCLDTCAKVADILGLGPCLEMSESEAESGGRKKKTILSDACEAVLGAVFLDGGFELSRAVVRKHWAGLLAETEPLPIDPKSALQEWALGRQLNLPRYVEIEREGPPHNPHFTTEVQVNGMQPARGEGGSKRASEHAAAKSMLEREGIWDAGGDG